MITTFTNEKLPHFFKYAKDKKESQVVEANNSFVNKLDSNDIIPNPRINYRKLGLGKIDYRLMMNDPDIECKVSLTGNGKLIKEETDHLIVRYCEFDKKYYLSLDNMICSDVDSYAKHYIKNQRITNEIKSELSQFGYDDREVADILVKYLYGIRNSGNKTALWMCYGNYIVENLEKIFKPQTKPTQCIDCGKWFEVSIFDSATCRCEKCSEYHKRELRRLKKQRYRDKKRGVYPTL